MKINYDKLWEILGERNMSKAEVIRAAGISTIDMEKFRNNQDVYVEILIKICVIFGCKINDIMEYEA